VEDPVALVTLGEGFLQEGLGQVVLGIPGEASEHLRGEEHRGVGRGRGQELRIDPLDPDASQDFEPDDGIDGPQRQVVEGVERPVSLGREADLVEASRQGCRSRRYWRIRVMLSRATPWLRALTDA